MAKRRMLAQDIIFDEDFNSLSIESQNLFLRLLTITDDCGIVPGNEYQLKTMLNLHSKIYSNLQKFLKELVISKLLISFTHNEKPFFAFKQEPFENYQAFIIKNRTRSEYLKLKLSDFQLLKSNLQEFTVNYGNYLDNGSYHIESKEYKVISKEYKDKEQKIEKIIPPLLEIVKEYFEIKEQSNEQAEKFFNYYESNGWKVGKNKMVNWHCAVANWIKNIKTFSNDKTPKRRNNIQEFKAEKTY